MTTFKEQIHKDFKNTFLNENEFGRVCLWNGKELKIVEDARLENELNQTQGVNVNKKIIYCCETDLNPRPRAYEAVELDGDMWEIVEVKNPIGHLVITLIRRTS